MTTGLPLPAKAALADLAEQFERWRQTRATMQERIPPTLWEQAVALTAALSCAQVARRRRLRSTDLRKRTLSRCRFARHPLDGAIYGFRNRAGTTLL